VREGERFGEEKMGMISGVGGNIGGVGREGGIGFEREGIRG
jgi:hypothetical protein